MSVCGELDVVVLVFVLPGGIPGCTVVLVADMGDAMSCSYDSYWLLTGSFGCELESTSAFGVVLAPSEAVWDTPLAWVKLGDAFGAESVR